MSPEQALDPKNVDDRSDLYALGCTLFYLLTGKPPFKEDASLSLTSKIESHASRELPPLKKYRNDVPKPLEQLLSKMTAKRQEDRPQSAREIVDELARIQPKRSDVRKYGAFAAVSFVLLAALFFMVIQPPPDLSDDTPPERIAPSIEGPIQIHSALINPPPTHHTVCMTLNIAENGEGFFGLERKTDTDPFDTDFISTKFSLSAYSKVVAFKGENGMGRLFFDMRDVDPKETWDSSRWWYFENVDFTGEPKAMQFKPAVEDGFAYAVCQREIRFPCRISAVMRDDFLGAIGIKFHITLKDGKQGEINCYMHNGNWGG